MFDDETIAAHGTEERREKKVALVLVASHPAAFFALCFRGSHSAFLRKQNKSSFENKTKYDGTLLKSQHTGG